MVHGNAWAATIYPVVSVYHTEGVRIENLSIDGNCDNNAYLDGCRGAGIFLYRAHGTVIKDCLIRRYNGDGISFQQSNDVQVISCVSEENAGLGLHPGSGSQRPVIRDCRAERNDQDGLFLCWRVQYGLFENNALLDNGRDGISIGHKDSDNLLRGNVVEGNRRSGVLFRDESEPMAGHRNRLEKNRIFNNGGGADGVGILIDGVTNDTALIGNSIGNTNRRPAVQKIPIRIGKKAGAVVLEDNDMEGKVEDLRADKR
jgi:parallel beta-helix repeat protein